MLPFVVVALCWALRAVNADINNHSFPEGFSVGVATAAYQVEGGWNDDGKGESIWDWWTHTYPNKSTVGENGDVACDSYHKWREDVELLKNLGVNHYRVSIAWSRILPDGLANNNTINRKGVEYYRNLFKALLDAGIKPYVTLYHWDIPLLLQQWGGWMNPATSDYFAAYARICFELFGDLIKNWFTINEPHTYCLLGYGIGAHAPGYAFPGEGVYKCAYTSLLAHAKAYHIYDDEFRAKQGGRISVVLDSSWYEPKVNNSKNVAAVQRTLDFQFGLYANPIYIGNWPEQVISIVDQRSALEGFSYSRLPKFTEDEIAFIKGTSDFFSLNTYSTFLVEHVNNPDEMINPANPSIFLDQGGNTSFDPSWPGDVDWTHLVPWGFRKLLNYVHNTYGQPEIVVTENGYAEKITTASLNDTGRITYIEQYFSALLDARFDDGVNVTGYTVWSVMDNLEWADGFKLKLGLARVDFSSPNRTRTPKSSYKWFKKVIANKCLVQQFE